MTNTQMLDKLDHAMEMLRFELNVFISKDVDLNGCSYGLVQISNGVYDAVADVRAALDATAKPEPTE